MVVDPSQYAVVAPFTPGVPPVVVWYTYAMPTSAAVGDLWVSGPDSPVFQYRGGAWVGEDGTYYRTVLKW